MADLVIILPEDLASYPGVTATEDQLGGLVDWVNQMVADAWEKPVDPIPFWVTNIALTAGMRASSNPRGLQSWTRSSDDTSRTERAGAAARGGLYLTPGESRRLAGRGRRGRMGTIRLSVG